MLCWPYFYDQHVTGRFVSKVWTVGLDMNDANGRSILENMVRELIDERRDELQPSMAKMSNLAQKKVLMKVGPLIAISIA